MFKGMDKIANEIVKNALRSLEADARNHERKASEARSLARAIRKFQPIVAEALKPPKPFKFKPLTNAQRKKLQASGVIPGTPVAAAR